MADELPIVSAAVEPVVEDTPAPTLAEHRAEFPAPTSHRQRAAPVVDAETPAEDIIASEKTKDRHRAKSQIANAKDTPRINTLTREKKDAIERAEKAEKELAAFRATPPVVETKPATETRVAAVEPAVPTELKKPDPNDLTKYPYGSADPQFIEDTADWKFETRTAAREAKEKTERETAAAETQKTEGRKRFNERWNKAKADIPNFEDIAKLPTLWPVGTGHPIDLWIWTRPDGPKVLWFLNDPANRAEAERIMALPTPDDQVVALALLEQRFSTNSAAAGVTGAVPTQAEIQPSPRPPTSVRTGPMRSSDTPPPEGSSLREHQRFYPQARRR